MITLVTPSSKHCPCSCMCQSKEVAPFPPLLCLLSEPLLAPFILQGEEVSVVVNQKILGKISRMVSVFLKQIRIIFKTSRVLPIPWCRLCRHLWGEMVLPVGILPFFSFSFWKPAGSESKIHMTYYLLIMWQWISNTYKNTEILGSFLFLWNKNPTRSW